MAADCSYCCSSMGFPSVCPPYCRADGSGLLILALVNGFDDGFRTVFLSGWRLIAYSFSRQLLSPWFACRIAQRMAADCSYFRSSKAFTMDCAPYCSADGSRLLLRPLVNSFHNGLPAIFPSVWQWIPNSWSRQRLSRRFACRIAQRMPEHCSFFRSSTASTTVFAPYYSADGSRWQRIAHASAHQWLPRWFAHGIAQRMAADGSRLLILPLVNGFHDGLHTVLLSGWQRIAHSCTRQWLLRQFSRRIDQRMAADGSGILSLPLVNGFHDGLRTLLLSGWQQMAADCSFFRSSMAFPMFCMPYCFPDGSGLLILALVNGFYDSFCAVFLCGWWRIAHSSARQWLFRCFACGIAERMAAD